MLADTDNVTFSTLFPIAEVPDMFLVNGQPDEFCKLRASRAERDKAQAENREPVADMVSVKFKLSSSTKWFNKHAKACERPTNLELESGRYNVQLDFVRKAKDPSQPLKASGYWVNSIMFSKQDANPFAGQAFEEGENESDDENDGALPGAVPTTAAPAPAAPTAPAQTNQEDGDDLPF